MLMPNPARWKAYPVKYCAYCWIKKKILISLLSVDCAIFGHYLYIYIYIYQAIKGQEAPIEQLIKEIEDLPGKWVSPDRNWVNASILFPTAALRTHQGGHSCAIGSSLTACTFISTGGLKSRKLCSDKENQWELRWQLNLWTQNKLMGSVPDCSWDDFKGLCDWGCQNKENEECGSFESQKLTDCDSFGIHCIFWLYLCLHCMLIMRDSFYILIVVVVCQMTMVLTVCALMNCDDFLTIFDSQQSMFWWIAAASYNRICHCFLLPPAATRLVICNQNF